MREPRVLHVVLDLKFGGLQRVLQDLTGQLAGEVESHVLVLSDPGQLAERVGRFAHVHVLPRQSRASLLWPARLTGAIRALHPDILHTHSGVWYKASLAGARAGVRMRVHTDHGRPYPDVWLGRRMDGVASSRTHHVVAVSEALADQMARTVTGGRRPAVIPNGIDSCRFYPAAGLDSRSALGVPAGALVIGSIGRLEPVKGYDVLIQAFARVARTLRDAELRLVLAGDGSQRGELEALARSAGVAEMVIFAGWHDAPEEVYRALDVFALSSHSEGTSLSLLEAMSSGVCPVVTDVGGNATVLGPSLTDVLVKPDDPEGMAEQLVRVLESHELRARWAQASRNRVLAEYDVQRTAAQYAQLYSEAALA